MAACKDSHASFCTSQMFKVFKSLDAYIYFECGFVNCLGKKQINSKTVTVAKVCINNYIVASLAATKEGS